MSDSPPVEVASDEARAEAAARGPAAQPAVEEPNLRGYFLFLAQRLFIYFSLYVLSIGPLYWPWYRSQFVGGSSVLAAFYLPLLKLAEWVPPLGAWLDWYISLWIG